MFKLAPPVLMTAMFVVAVPVRAQMDAPPIPSVLPKISSISVENAAGVLEYCLQNNLVSSVGVDAVLGGLSEKLNQNSADYSAGATGKILGDGGKNFMIAGAPNYLQSSACDMVLQRAKTLK